MKISLYKDHCREHRNCIAIFDTVSNSGSVSFGGGPSSKGYYMEVHGLKDFESAIKRGSLCWNTRDSKSFNYGKKIGLYVKAE